MPPLSGAVSRTRLRARGCRNRPGSRCSGQGQRKLELCRVAAARWGQEGAHWLSRCSLDLTAPAGVAGQVPGNSGHRWQRRKGRQEVTGGKTVAQTISVQSTSHCLDGRENVTGVACYRIFKPVGQTYLCPNSIFSWSNLVVEALECFQVGQGSGTRDLGDSPHRIESHGKLSAPMCVSWCFPQPWVHDTSGLVSSGTPP